LADRDRVSVSPTETIDCPLCLAEGRLKRTEVLDRLGVKDFARVAQLSAEEAFRLLQQKHGNDSQHIWARFESELTKRTADLELRHRSELQALNAQKETLNRRVEDSLREVAHLRDENQDLELEMSKVSRIGKREEMDFADEARTWAGIAVSEKLGRNGDFYLSYRDHSGASLEPRMLVDNKDKSVISEGDIDKLVRDARERSIAVAVLVARSEDQLRHIDRETRWNRKDGIWVLRTTRQWLPRDLDVLRPLFEQMRIHGSDFLERNSALADEVRRTFADLDRIEGELKKATKAISSASGLVTKYRSRLQELCESAVGRKMPAGSELSTARIG
jgi:predicted nuclease with TOPRIM domain